MPNWLPINPSELRYLAVITKPSATRDEANQAVGGDIVATPWVKVKTITDREFVENAQVTSHSTHIITLRYTHALIASGQTLNIGARKWTIQTVDDVELRHLKIELQCLEVNSANV